MKSLQEENQNLRDRLNDALATENKFLREQMKSINESLQNSTKTNKYALSAFNFITSRFSDAPALKKVDSGSMETIVYKNTEHQKIVRILIYHHNHRTLARYIGDSIVDYYRKDNPEEQSIWNSDTKRLTYIIRLIINDDPKWSIDKGGIDVLSLIIEPLLEYIYDILKEFILDRSYDDRDNIFEHVERMKTAQEISMRIKDDKSLSHEILSYIAPFFHLNQKVKTITLEQDE